jgi:hypothetical protein
MTVAEQGHAVATIKVQIVHTLRITNAAALAFDKGYGPLRIGWNLVLVFEVGIETTSTHDFLL